MTGAEKIDNNWMLTGDDRHEVVRRATALGITGTPDQASHNLGTLTLANGRVVTAHVVHAVDAVITDGVSVVLINRVNPPGKGLPALPGGFLDPKGAGVESAMQAAAREALEEAGINLGSGQLIGVRNMNRPQDVRIATADLPDHNIKKGDVFMVSTQAVRFDVANLASTNLVAGDDAVPGSAHLKLLCKLTREGMGIADHFDMIVSAIPEAFVANGAQRPPNPAALPDKYRAG